MISTGNKKVKGLFLTLLFLTGNGRIIAQIDDLPIVPFVPKEDTIELIATDNTNCVISFESHDGTIHSGIKTTKYFDDFGRLEETVIAGHSPNQKDMVSYTDYDDAGRLFGTWLPGISDNSDGSFVLRSQAVSLSSTANSDTAPYSMALYEPSPLNRTVIQYAPGAIWHDKMKAVRTDYIVNMENESHLNVLSIRAEDRPGDAIDIIVDDNLPTGTLQGVKTTDEEGNERYEFRDLWGNIILIRSIVDNEEYNTYYVYDSMGNLRAVLPPAIMEDGTTFGTIDSDFIDQYAYLYRYDNLFRLAAKKLPGIDWQYMFYDNADRLVFSQDGNQRTRNEFTFYIYDAIGRECIRGVFTPQYSIDNLSDFVKCTFTGNNNVWKGYDISGISINSPSIMNVNYYDNYDFISYSSVTTWPNDRIPLFHSPHIQSNTQGLLTGCVTAISDESIESNNVNYLYKTIYYDERNRIIHTEETNIMGGTDTEDLLLGFTGNLLHRTHIQKGNSQDSITEIYTYSYDHAQRIKEVKHKLDNNTERTIAQYDYDDLGRIAKKTLGNGEALGYRYNVRGWMSQLDCSKFHELLEYNYNGNISSLAWLTTSSCPDGYYNFTYDNLSRLTCAQWNNPDSDYDYGVDYSYDRMGNILTLQRRGMQKTADGEDYACTVDDLTMSYNGNQLIQVSDDHHSIDDKRLYDFWDGADEAIEYQYDNNGNMTQDQNKGISKINYSRQNLPLCIRFPNDSIKYSYSTNGEKLSTTYYNTIYSVISPTRPFIPSTGSAQVRPVRLVKTTNYCKNFTYNLPELTRIDFDGGYISFGFRSSKPIYHYYLQDHQGNNRMVLSEDDEIEQEMHYYPFGGIMGESSEGNAQPFRYNGKEYETMGGLNMHDYGARFYDQTLGRWHVMDEKAEDYYDISPYAYCMNNPVNAIDPDGKEVWLFATKLPGLHVPLATHTFLVVTGDDGKVLRYAAYGPKNGKPVGGDKLTECQYSQDIQVYTDYFNGKENDNLKGQPQKVNIPKGMTSKEFDNKVIQTINSFGNKDGITYTLFGGGNDKTLGNCNTSSSTVLIKSGVGKEEMKSLESNIEGINTGFQTTTPKPWTKKEQEKALEEKKNLEQSNRLKAL